METSNLFLQTPSSLLGALVVLLLIYLISSSIFSPKEGRKEPPGPRTLPLSWNLLQLDFKTQSKTLLEFSKKYGSVFT
ncbi:cytochrome P450 2K1-like isoform X2, partial [Lates japonicus]